MQMPIGRWSLAVLLLAVAASEVLVSCRPKEEEREKTITYTCGDEDVAIQNGGAGEAFLCEGNNLEWKPDADYEIRFENDDSCLDGVPGTIHVSPRSDANDRCVPGRPKCKGKGKARVCTYKITATHKGEGESSDPHIILMPPGTH
jgi:hypothetical protein